MVKCRELGAVLVVNYRQRDFVSEVIKNIRLIGSTLRDRPLIQKIGVGSNIGHLI